MVARTVPSTKPRPRVTAVSQRVRVRPFITEVAVNHSATTPHWNARLWTRELTAMANSSRATAAETHCPVRRRGTIRAVAAQRSGAVAAVPLRVGTGTSGEAGAGAVRTSGGVAMRRLQAGGRRCGMRAGAHGAGYGVVTYGRCGRPASLNASGGALHSAFDRTRARSAGVKGPRRRDAGGAGGVAWRQEIATER